MRIKNLKTTIAEIDKMSAIVRRREKRINWLLPGALASSQKLDEALNILECSKKALQEIQAL